MLQYKVQWLIGGEMPLIRLLLEIDGEEVEHLLLEQAM